MLETIIGNFGNSKNENLKFSQPETPTPIPEIKKCEKCDSVKFWRPFHSTDWHCFICQKPPSVSLAEEIRDFRSGRGVVRDGARWVDWVDVERHKGELITSPHACYENSTGTSLDVDPDPGAKVHLVATVMIQSPDVPICQRCRCHRYQEYVFSDGRVEQRCTFCKQEVFDWR